METDNLEKVDDEKVETEDMGDESMEDVEVIDKEKVESEEGELGDESMLGNLDDGGKVEKIAEGKEKTVALNSEAILEYWFGNKAVLERMAKDLGLSSERLVEKMLGFEKIENTGYVWERFRCGSCQFEGKILFEREESSWFCRRCMGEKIEECKHKMAVKLKERRMVLRENG